MKTRGYKQTEEHKRKRGLFLRGEKNQNWKGDKVKYRGLHIWVEEVLGKPKKCKNCGTIEAKKFEWANISGKYFRDAGDWIRLCTSCHMKSDDRIKNLAL